MNGVIVIDKKAGMTSFDVVARMRKLCGMKKVGHMGTLDPAATGVLPVCLGNATRAADLLTAGETKTYRAILRLGQETDTEDAEGCVTKTGDASHVTREDVEAVLPFFTGDIFQTPPMYSARKVGGTRLYRLARCGVAVERTPQRVTVDRLAVLSMEGTDVTLEVVCSRGTYIRTLCRDIGERLGCFGHMASLRRLQSGAFTLEDAVTLTTLEKEGALAHLIPTEALFDYPVFLASKKQARLVRNGVAAYCEGTPGRYKVMTEDGEFLSVSDIADTEEGRVLKLVKSFYGGSA